MTLWICLNCQKRQVAFDTGTPCKCKRCGVPWSYLKNMGPAQ